MSDVFDENFGQIDEWAYDVFKFTEDCLNMRPAEPIDELKGKAIPYTNSMGEQWSAILFDRDGRLVYHDLSFYKKEMFKNQNRGSFKKYKNTRFTWHQTVLLEAYRRAVNTFDQDSFNESLRWITARSGHGTGKSSSLAIISLHFLICFFGSQIGTTANTEYQLKDILMKEISIWKRRLPDWLEDNIVVLDDSVRIEGEKDWFLRARVARKENPEALAGVHGSYVLLLADEASGIHDKIFEVMKGATTGPNCIVMYTSNPTRTEGEFWESHKAGSSYVKLHFDSRNSPIVDEGYIQRIIDDYGEDSEEYAVRVAGEFPDTAEMDEQGWMPLLANITILFEKEQGQKINGGVIGVDPSGQGEDHSSIGIRDNVYLKEVLNEKVSSEPDLARKVESVRDAYNSQDGDVGVDAFGIGARVVSNIRTKMNESVNAILLDKPREDKKQEFASYRAELAWRLREWIRSGGIIITNNKQAWMRELEKIKYKRDGQGRITIMDKPTFKKEYGFSPDRFDMAILTFHRDYPMKLKEETLASQEERELAQAAQQQNVTQNVDELSTI